MCYYPISKSICWCITTRSLISAFDLQFKVTGSHFNFFIIIIWSFKLSKNLHVHASWILTYISMSLATTYIFMFLKSYMLIHHKILAECHSPVTLTTISRSWEASHLEFLNINAIIWDISLKIICKCTRYWKEKVHSLVTLTYLSMSQVTIFYFCFWMITLPSSEMSPK